MGIITKGMGAILKSRYTGKSSKMAEKGYKVIKDKRYTPEGGMRTQKRMAGPLVGFNTKPKMPGTKTGKGQGTLFREKYGTMPKDPNVLPGQLKFNFRRKGITGRYNRGYNRKLKTLTEKAEIK